MEEALLVSPLRDWKIGITGPPYKNNYWLRKMEGEKPFECWCHEKLLGKGGFGEVWREVCKEGAKNYGQVRAVKKISKKQAGFLKSSQTEILALTTFSKEKYRDRFVQFIGWYEDKDHLYLAMEFMKYGDLQQYIDGLAPFSEPQAAAIAKQVALALKHMHTNGFIHRDLKPLNILVASKEPTWRVKVADFGIAKNVDGDSFFTHYIGTRGYMAPELFRSSAVSYTAAVDVWALGAVVYCMLTGAPPFDSLDELFKFSTNLLQFPTRELGASTGFCIDFVLGAMDPSPTKRLSIDRILAHEWLSLDGRGAFRDLSLSKPLSLTIIGTSWRLTSSQSSSNKTGLPRPTSKPAFSEVVALNNISPHGGGNGEIYCMVCWAKFDRRDNLFQHSLEAGHIVHPGKEVWQEYFRPAKDRIKVKKLERQTRQEKETQSWKEFLQDQEQKNLKSSGKKRQGGMETIVNFIQEQERTVKEEEQQRLMRKRKEVEEQQRLLQKLKEREEAQKKEEQRQQKLKEAKEREEAQRKVEEQARKEEERRRQKLKEARELEEKRRRYVKRQTSDPDYTCMLCLEEFDTRGELFEHMDEENHRIPKEMWHLIG